MQILSNSIQVRELVQNGDAENRSRVVVMTMGALHEGHLSLVAEAKNHGNEVWLTDFVNPLQFGPNEDYENYPRDLKRDRELAQGAGEDVFFAPKVEEIYPNPASLVTVNAGVGANILEGASRPGHFNGVLTVVLKFLNLIQPRVAVFGQKDLQQLLLIKKMVADFNLPVEIVAAPIIRTECGLAKSSRNVYLSENEQVDALVLSKALNAGVQKANSGGKVSEVVTVTRGIINYVSGVETDYVTVLDPVTMNVATDIFSGQGYLLVAARVGKTRLIDNVELQIQPSAVGS